MLKGEDYHVLVKSENVSQVVDLFKEYGYYVNFQKIKINYFNIKHILIIFYNYWYVKYNQT